MKLLLCHICGRHGTQPQVAAGGPPPSHSRSRENGWMQATISCGRAPHQHIVKDDASQRLLPTIQVRLAAPTAVCVRDEGQAGAAPWQQLTPAHTGRGVMVGSTAAVHLRRRAHCRRCPSPSLPQQHWRSLVRQFDDGRHLGPMPPRLCQLQHPPVVKGGGRAVGAAVHEYAAPANSTAGRPTAPRRRFTPGIRLQST